jgi:hypothetical protein
MSVTQNSQLLSETAQAGEANACCLALGYTIYSDAVTGEEMCAGPTPLLPFPLSNACVQAQMSSIQGPSPEQESAGSGFVAGFTSILDSLGTAATGVLGALNPQPQTPTQSTYVTPAQSNRGKQVITIAVFVLVVGVVLIMLRRKK